MKNLVNFCKFSFFIALIALSSLGLADIRPKSIAITQIVAHDSLDQVRLGIIYELRAKYGENIKINLSNANGSIVTATQIASKLASNKPDLIIAITTPSAQTVANATKNTKIPVLFATVSDPIGAKLVNSLERPGGNISGTRNLSPLNEQLLLTKELAPQLKELGIILSGSEANSVYLLKQLRKIAQGLNIEIIAKTINNSGEVKLAAESLVDKVDGFFLLQDNTVASSLPILVKVATRQHKPIFSSFLEAVENGALAGLARSEYNIGRQTGLMAITILEGADIATTSVQDPQEIELMINNKVARILNITIPQTVLQKAHKLF
jgi:putative ABC transport system substrate-binding protein